jgi:hypothetical protein
MTPSIPKIDPLARLRRLQRGAEHLHRLGARATSEFLLEIGGERFPRRAPLGVSRE